MKFNSYNALLRKGACAVTITGLSVITSGCATIVNGSSESMSVSSAPTEGANCTLTNSQGTYYLTTPGTVTVQKTKTDLHVQCEKVG